MVQLWPCAWRLYQGRFIAAHRARGGYWHGRFTRPVLLPEQGLPRQDRGELRRLQAQNCFRRRGATKGELASMPLVPLSGNYWEMRK